MRPVATIKDIMTSIIAPTSDVLWSAVSTDIGPNGPEEHMPRTDEEWAAVRKSAVQLLESTNLLLIEGRRVAKPGEKSAAPGAELEPDQIDALIKADRQTFARLALAMQEPVELMFRAIDARDAPALSEAGAALDTACGTCHKKYWYPSEKTNADTAPTPAPGN